MHVLYWLLLHTAAPFGAGCYAWVIARCIFR